MKTFKNKKELIESTLEELPSPEILERFEKGAMLKTPILGDVFSECPDAPCCPNLKHGILECTCCNWSEI